MTETNQTPQQGKKIYFASDFHLGTPDYESSLVREKKVVAWLEQIRRDADSIYLIGDVFDFWFEYGNAAPKGFVRLLGKLAELADQGIKIHLFTGNHDMWIFDYLPREIGLSLYREPIIRTFNGVKFYIGHGDGLGPGDHGYKFIKKVFANKLCQWLFRWIHPDIGIGMANYWSRKSRNSANEKEAEFLGEEKEWLVIYSKEVLQREPIDYFVFGHRHLPIEHQLSESSVYINLGDWITHFTYGVFDGEKMQLKTYDSASES